MSAVITRPWPSRWRATLALGLALLAGVLLLYRDTALSMVTTWSRSDTYAHAFLVPPIVLWLVWRRRQALADITPQPQLWMLLPMAAAGVLWLLGHLATVNAAMEFALVAMIVLLVPAVAGLAVARELLFPLAFLFFAVPIGEFLTPAMIARTADATVTALRWSGVPVYREGMQFVIPSGQWSVVEACSGVRYLIASFMVGSLFAYLNYRSTRRRLLFVGVSIVVPIVANWMRAYMIVMLGHLSDNRIATGVDHIIYGWVFFGIVILLMFAIGARWVESDEPAAAPRAVSAAADASVPAWNQASSALLLAGVALAVTWPHLAASALQRGPSTLPPQLSLPATLDGGWQASDEPLSTWAPNFLSPALTLRQSYLQAGHAGHPVAVYIGYYRQQGAQSKLVSSLNTLAESSHMARWSVAGTGSRTLALPGGPVTLQTTQLRGSDLSGGGAGERLLVWRVYWVNGLLTASDSRAKIEEALGRLQGQGDDGAVLLFYTPYADGELEAAQAALQAFATSQLEPLQGLLRRARELR